MYNIPKEVPIMLGARGIAKIEGKSPQCIQAKFKRGKFRTITIAEGTRRVHTLHLLRDVWGIDAMPHLERIGRLPAAVPVYRAAWELSMPQAQFRRLFPDLIEEDDTVAVEALLDIAHS